MKFDASVNTLISEIMSNNSSAVMLCAPAGTGKTDLITELASRYRTVFWLNALSPDISCFASYLCDKIVEDNDEFKDKLSQLLRCKSVYHGETVVLTALLDYVSRIKGNCLMVFERAESLPPDFKLENIERLIKHCPPNLKIVISSDRFINFDYRKFEPLCPKLVDENSFTIHDTINFDEYIENLSDKDKAFLAYISDLSTARVDFADYIYPADSQQHGGKELLSYLSRKEGFVAIRDNDFHINSLFAKYLSQVKDKYPNFFGEFAEIAVAKRYADYIFKVKREFSSVALRLYAELGDLDMINEAVKFLCHCQKDIWRSYDIVKSLRIDELKPFHSEEYVFYNFLCGLSLGILKSYEECKRVFKEVYFQFKEKGLIWPAILCLHQLLRIPNADDNEFKEECVEMFLKHGKEEPIYFDFLFTATVRYRKDLELTMSDILNTIDQRGEKKSPTYILMKEHLAYYYFDISNYKKAIELAEEIHAYTPYYTVPHNFIAFKYYAGDVDEAKKSAEEALSFAEENEIGQDTGLLYGTLAMIDAYHGRINEALTKYDLSVKADIKDSPAQLFNVGQRCLAYAQHKDANYAKDVSHIYLKYCEIYQPKYVNIMMLALSYAYMKLGRHELAYQYATKCVQASTSKSTHWLMGMAIATNYLLAKGELQDADTLIGNIFKASCSYGLEMLIVNYFNCIFKPLAKYASRHGIESEYIEKIESMLEEKQTRRVSSNMLKITMFGDVLVSVDGKEIIWKTKKSKDLFLHYLLHRNTGIDRGVIINILWKDYLYDSAINNLKTTNNIIRRTLSAYNIGFSLNYANSKYGLTLKSVDNDFYAYCALRDKFHLESSLPAMVKLMNQMLKLYRGDFATDMTPFKEFNDERKSLKQDLIVMLLKLVRGLSAQEDFIEAKRFLSALIIIDKQNDYQKAVAELDAKIKI